MRALVLVLAVLPATVTASIFGTLFAGERPADVGRGTLAACPQTPNCVASRASDPAHAIAPLRFGGAAAAAMHRLATAAAALPGARVVAARPDYLHVEFVTRIMGFVDDLEAVPDPPGVIHVRSASRIGRDDFGVNRERVEALRAAFGAAAPDAPPR